MLQPFGRDLWIVDGPAVSVAGFVYPTRMAVIRLSDGALLIWSPTALSDELQAAVDDLGSVRHLVAPTRCTMYSLVSGRSHTRTRSPTPCRHCGSNGRT
ncbi:DUF4336 domain-containing protein [uncultured Sphingomonas sp.]|uniref:DUF4336 domain-containing protein n=1 Tax=uncultured Sphingomonas sp. TaxID=158754 RepID=UPI0034577BDA